MLTNYILSNLVLKAVTFLAFQSLFSISSWLVLKFMYPEEAKNFCEIFTLLLTTLHTVKSKVKIPQNFVVFSEYMNFKW